MNEKEIIKGQSGNSFRLYIAILGVIAVIPFAILIETTHIAILGVIGGVILWGSILFAIFSSPCEIIVTDKKVRGKALFSKRVELPFDMVSAVSTCMCNGIGVSTSSGVIKFLSIKNNLEVYNVISELLEKRQDNTNNNVNMNEHYSVADELKKYKDLLDSGAITQEEYDQKKKELLK